MKPVTLLALLQAGKLSRNELYPCPRKLRLDGHQLDCTHPQLGRPLEFSELITYSCNCGVAHLARRFAPGELAAFLRLQNFSARSVDGPEQQLQAIGADYVNVTPFRLAAAYSRIREPLIVKGLEDAVRFGTAQGAALPNISVAGKTGTVRTGAGLHAAWFAGFAPSRNPQLAIAVFAQGLSGGGDAAPVAREVLRKYLA